MFASTWSRNGEYGQTMGYEMIGADWREESSWSFNSVFNRFPQFANAGFGSPGGFSIAVRKPRDNPNNQVDFRKTGGHFLKKLFKIF